MEHQNLDFTFVQDEHVRSVLEAYYTQALQASEAASYLGAIVACGSVVEGWLTWTLLQKEELALKSSKACKDKQGRVRPLKEEIGQKDLRWFGDFTIIEELFLKALTACIPPSYPDGKIPTCPSCGTAALVSPAVATSCEGTLRQQGGVASTDLTALSRNTPLATGHTPFGVSTMVHTRPWWWR